MRSMRLFAVHALSLFTQERVLNKAISFTDSSPLQLYSPWHGTAWLLSWHHGQWDPATRLPWVVQHQPCVHHRPAGM